MPLRKGKNAKQPIREVAIAYDMDWQKQHWQSLQTAYGSAPFWEHYAPQLEPFFLKRWDYLFDLNMAILETFLKILKLKNTVTVSFSTDYEMNFTAKEIIDTPSGARQERVDLRNKILPNKTNFQGEKYAQLFQERTGFLPNLSILDLIFCTGPQALTVIKS